MAQPELFATKCEEKLAATLSEWEMSLLKESSECDFIAQRNNNKLKFQSDVVTLQWCHGYRLKRPKCSSRLRQQNVICYR